MSTQPYEAGPATMPCLHDVFREVEGLPHNGIKTDTMQYLGDAVLRFDGLSHGMFGCPRRTCGRLGRMCFFPTHDIEEWPGCPRASQEVNATDTST